MPNPGTVNNELGINSFSGPMGEKEPAYGAIERMKILSALAPVGSPAAVGAPRRAKRAAMRGKVAAQGTPAPGAPLPTPPDAAFSPSPTPDPYQAQLVAFWTSVASDPNASPLVKQYAMAAQQNGS